MQATPKPYHLRDQFFWTDLPDALAALENQPVRPEAKGNLRHWIDEGYAIVRDAVDDASIRDFTTAFDALLDSHGGELRMTYWGSDGHHSEAARRENLHQTEAKVLDLHSHLPQAAALVFSDRIRDFLSGVFQDEIVAFQSLYFEVGSQQGAHQDTAFVYTQPALMFAASWIALEDISPGSGELFFFPRSHKLDDFLFAPQARKMFDQRDPDAGRYSAYLEAQAAAAGCVRDVFLPRRGDVLFWAADLIHGGSPRVLDTTRRSIVTHYCPKRAVVPYAQHRNLAPRLVRPGCWLLSNT